MRSDGSDRAVDHYAHNQQHQPRALAENLGATPSYGRHSKGKDTCRVSQAIEPRLMGIELRCRRTAKVCLVYLLASYCTSFALPQSPTTKCLSILRNCDSRRPAFECSRASTNVPTPVHASLGTISFTAWQWAFVFLRKRR